MNLKQNIAYNISRLSGVFMKFMKPSHGLRILMYHSINKADLTNKKYDPFGLYTIDPLSFKMQIEEIKSYSISKHSKNELNKLIIKSKKFLNDSII